MAQRSFEQFTEDKIWFLSNTISLITTKKAAELNDHRLQVLKDHLQDYRDKIAKGRLQIEIDCGMDSLSKPVKLFDRLELGRRLGK